MEKDRLVRLIDQRADVADVDRLMQVDQLVGLAQAAASVFGVAASYVITASFRRRKPEGIAAWADVLSFCASASIGLIGNLSLAGMLYSETQTWWLAGAAGIAISTLWTHMSRSAAAVRRS